MWGQWSICENICGGSVINRTRRCDNPAPKAGGSGCHGNTVETKLECAWPCESKLYGVALCVCESWNNMIWY
jgi:hypothetical protein